MRRRLGVPGRLTERASALVRSVEPLVQAGRMELVLARVTRQLGQGAVDHVDDGVANRTFLHALKHLV